MIKKQALVLTFLSFLSLSQDSFAMESNNDIPAENSEKRPREPHSNNGAEEEEEEECVLNENRFINEQEKDQKFRPFNTLPLEVTCYILFRELESIIHGNSIFKPLDGVREFLNALSLTNKEFHAIAEDLGWNNRLASENKEPRYKLMVKAWFIPEILGCPKECLDVWLRDIIYRSKEIREYDPESFTEIETDRLKLLLSSLKKVKSDSERVKAAAKLLIAGAESNFETEHGETLLEYILAFKGFHCLVPLLILRGVDTTNKEALTYVLSFPQILKMLINSNSQKTDFDRGFYTELLKDVVKDEERKLKTVTMLLKSGASPIGVLPILMAAVKVEGSDYEINEEDLLDAEIAKLLIKFGADINQLPDQTCHPIINLKWLAETKAIQDLQKNKS